MWELYITSYNQLIGHPYVSLQYVLTKETYIDSGISVVPVPSHLGKQRKHTNSTKNFTQFNVEHDHTIISSASFLHNAFHIGIKRRKSYKKLHTRNAHTFDPDLCTYNI